MRSIEFHFEALELKIKKGHHQSNTLRIRTVQVRF